LDFKEASNDILMMGIGKDNNIAISFWEKNLDVFLLC
jgi:hypothetical protein